MIETYLKEGIHNFNFPFVGYRGENIGNCSIELHLGAATGINPERGIEISVIITQQNENAPALEHFIENVCTHLKTWLEAHTGTTIETNTINWYQVLPYYNNGIWKKVDMEWDAKNKFYHTARWRELQPLRSVVSEG